MRGDKPGCLIRLSGRSGSRRPAERGVV